MGDLDAVNSVLYNYRNTTREYGGEEFFMMSLPCVYT